MRILLLCALLSMSLCSHAGALANLLAAEPQAVGLHPLLGQHFLAPLSAVDEHKLPLPNAAHSNSDIVLQDLRPSLNARSYGSWQALDPDIWLWRLRLSSAKPLLQSLQLRGLKLPKDAVLYLYEASSKRLLAQWSQADVNDLLALWTPWTASSELVFELQIPKAATAAFKLQLTQVQYAGLTP